MTVSGILVHERVFQRIANQNGGTRASGTPGYDASAGHLAGRLRAAGYTVTELVPAELEQVSPTPTVYETGTFDLSGSGEVTGQVFAGNDIVSRRTRPPAELHLRLRARRLRPRPG